MTTTVPPADDPTPAAPAQGADDLTPTPTPTLPPAPLPRRAWLLGVTALLMLLVLAVAGIGAAGGWPTLARRLGLPDNRPFNGATADPPVALAPLTLARADGATLTTAALRGRVSLFFFGYTHCPDVCPTTLLEMAEVRKELGRRADVFDSYFVTVDPERDSAEVLREYVARMDPRTAPLTGTPEQLRAAYEAFGVFYERRDLPGSSLGYAMDHTAGVFVVDRAGRIVLMFPFGMTAEQMAEDIGRLAA